MERQVNLGNFFEYTATGGHPHAVPWWADILGWIILGLVVTFAFIRGVE